MTVSELLVKVVDYQKIHIEDSCFRYKMYFNGKAEDVPYDVSQMYVDEICVSDNVLIIKAYC